MSEQTRWALHNIVGPVVVAIVVGMASSYLTVQFSIVRFDERILKNTEALQAIQAARESKDDQDRALRDKLIEVNTKVDMLLSFQRKGHQ